MTESSTVPNRSPSLLVVHVVWSTYRRRPLLPEPFDPTLRRILAAKAHDHGSTLIAAGFAPDHAHVVVRLAATVSLSVLVQNMKGGGAFDANRHPERRSRIAWQAGYWAESVSPADCTLVVRYVKHQRTHHDPSHPSERWQFAPNEQRRP